MCVLGQYPVGGAMTCDFKKAFGHWPICFSLDKHRFHSRYSVLSFESSSVNICNFPKCSYFVSSVQTTFFQEHCGLLSVAWGSCASRSRMCRPLTAGSFASVRCSDTKTFSHICI